MPIIKFEGKVFEVDENGYLKDWQSWDSSFTINIASKEKITLTTEHWVVIEFLREFYGRYQIAPDIKYFVKEIGRRLGDTEKGTVRYIYKLFPVGPILACRYAGIPKPVG